MEPVEVIEYKGYTIEVIQDENPESPREWDNLGTMVCFHNHYILGDKHNLSIEDVKEIAESPDNICLPLYLYDHSGITMSTSPFSCPWDSGQVGIIYVTKEKVREEYSVKRISKKVMDKVINCLIQEVKTYDDYLTGNVFEYVIKDSQDELVDSCSGFFGDTKYMIDEAKGHIDYTIEAEYHKANDDRLIIA